METGGFRGSELYDLLAARGVSRRSFLKLCGGLAAALGLSSAMAPRIASAIEATIQNKTLLPVVWIEAGSCTGCTESFAQAGNPDVATVVLDVISLNYSETLSAGAGHSLEAAKDETIEQGGYILVYEGAVMTGWDGNALRVAGEKGTDILLEAASNAIAVIACGSCAVDGGWGAGDPNPAGAMGVQKFLADNGVATPVVNIPACPANPENVLAVIVNYLLMGHTLPELTQYGMPKGQYGQVIHDNCPRRGHFENGEFVYKFGSIEEKQGFCLYAMGCRGPQTYSNCPVVRWNRKSGWCVEAGAPCCGCAEANPFTNVENWVNRNAPFTSSRLRDVKIGGLSIQPTVIGGGLAAAVAAVLVVHGFGMKKAGRTGDGAPIETMKDYDRKKLFYKKKMEQLEAKAAREQDADDAEGGDAR